LPSKKIVLFALNLDDLSGETTTLEYLGHPTNLFMRLMSLAQTSLCRVNATGKLGPSLHLWPNSEARKTTGHHRGNKHKWMGNPPATAMMKGKRTSRCFVLSSDPALENARMGIAKQLSQLSSRRCLSEMACHIPARSPLSRHHGTTCVGSNAVEIGPSRVGQAARNTTSGSAFAFVTCAAKSEEARGTAPLVPCKMVTVESPEATGGDDSPGPDTIPGTDGEATARPLSSRDCTGMLSFEGGRLPQKTCWEPGNRR